MSEKLEPPYLDERSLGRFLRERLDPEVLAWFRTQGPGYQTRMNAVLKAYMEAAEA